MKRRKVEIVISGATGRFPSSANLEEFKENLFNSVDMVTEDDKRWPVGLWNLPGRNGKMPNMDRFDREFFAISESDVLFIDPQERLLLEATYEAIVDAGVDPESLKGSNTGFFYGSCFQETHCQFDDPTMTPAKIRTLVTRVSRHFKLRGPIVQTDTACGSSFSALAEAFTAMRAGVCDQIICAGSNTLFRPRVSLQFRDLKMIAKDGKCKCLDSGANGYVRSEACVVFLLQKKEDAKRIYCTILNAKSNSDGYKVEGITFPSINGQKRLVGQVYKEVAIDPSSINYIEAHVTGTKAGDPVEMNAMYDVICTNKTPQNPLYVGCLKSNMGHTEGASGLCALAKACIIFQTRLIPPNLHFISPNLNIKGLVDGKMIPVNQVTPFTGSLIPVNCFGFGGANVHVLAEAFDRPSPDIRITQPIPRIIPVAGRTSDSVTYIYQQLSTKQDQYLTRNFLSILTDFSNIPPERGMSVRGYAVVTEKGGKYVITPHPPERVKKLPIAMTFVDAEECTATFKELQKIDVFAEAIRDMETILKTRVEGNFNGTTEAKIQRILQSVAVQIGLVDILFSLGVQPESITGKGTGILAAAYAEDCLSAEEAILSAYHYSIHTSTGTSNGMTNGAMVNGITCKGSNYSGKEFSSLKESLESLIILPKRMSKQFMSAMNCKATNCKPATLTGDLLARMLSSSNTGKDNSVKSSSILEFEVGPSFAIKQVKAPGYDDSSPLMNLLNSIGKIYMNGSKTRVARLYPLVVYPLPSSTASLSSLIKWNHEVCYPLAPFLVQSTSYYFQTSRDMMFHFDRRHPEDAFLFDHKIDGRVLFPATGYLMMAWTAFAKLNNFCVYDCPIEFRDVSFERATVMSPTETKLTIRINEDNGGFVIKEGENLVARGSVRFLSKGAPYQEPIAARLNPPPSDLIQMESKDLYREFRIRGYDYGQYFQGLNNSRSDGRSGSLIWRDVLAKSFKESMSLETDEEQSQLWLRSWITFSDAMFQLLLLSQADVSRNLFVPRKVESVICFPEVLRTNINDSPKYLDSMTLSEASNLTAYADPDENLVWVRGLIIKGLKTSLLKRRAQYVRHKKYYYAPNIETATLDNPDDIKRVQKYYEEVVSLARRINKGEMDPFLETSVDLEDDRHSLLRLLVHKLKGGKVDPSLIYVGKDLLIGRTDDDWFFPEHFLKPHLEKLVYNCVEGSGMKVDVLEWNPDLHKSYFLLTKVVQSYADESLLYDQTVFNYTLVHPNPSHLDPGVAGSIKEIIEMKKGPMDIPTSHLIIYRCPEETGGITDHETLFQQFFSMTHESGFLLIVAKDNVVNRDLEQVLVKLGVQQHSTTPTEKLVETAVRKGFTPISQKTLLGDVLPLKTILFKKKSTDPSSLKHVQLSVGLTNHFDWLPKMRERLTDLKADQSMRLWLTPDFDSKVTPMAPKEKATGLLGFVKSLRLEPGYDRVRLLIDLEEEGAANIHNSKYGEMLENDLVYNIWGGEKRGWLQYEHLSMPRQVHEDPCLKQAMEHAYLKTMKAGDLSSFFWVQADYASVDPCQIATVYYAPLNFRDIMFATGRLSPEAIPGIPPQVSQDSILGLEFAGTDCNGNRVMGVVPYKALATSVVMSDLDLVWPVPKGWTMEEASTVPCVYATAYYALIIRGNLMEGESVLIHAGAGGVGLAAISIALSKKCRVFTTVGSSQKRQYLLKEFPQLSSSDIFYSRDTTFEDDILKATNGEGVDVILNSLAEEKLQAGLRCLAPNARFLEIGKVDFIQDNPLYTAQEMDGNRSFHGVLLDSLFKYSENDHFPQKLLDEKRQLRRLVLQGIEDGTVRPLRRTIFDKEKLRKPSGSCHLGSTLERWSSK